MKRAPDQACANGSELRVAGGLRPRAIPSFLEKQVARVWPAQSPVIKVRLAEQSKSDKNTVCVQLSASLSVLKVMRLRCQKLAEQPYELFMFARKHGLPISAAREILADHGADRDACDRAAKATPMQHQSG